MLLLLFAGGCSGARRAGLPTELPAAFPNHTLEQILSRLEPAPESLTSFTTRASVAFYSPDRSGSFTANLNHRRNDSLYMSIRVTLGVEAARTLVTPDSFFVYDRINQELIYGSLEEIGTLLPAPFASDNLLPELFGYFSPDTTVAWRVVADTARYYLFDPAGRYTYAIDPILWRVVRYTEEDPSGTIIEERTFQQYDVFDDYILPRRITFRRPQDRVSASLYYRDLTLNPPKLSFDIRVNDGARRIPASDLY